MTIYKGEQAAALMQRQSVAGEPRLVTGRKVGRTTEYLVRRIKRDHPEVAARIACYPSLWGAAAACGIVKPRGHSVAYLKERLRRERPLVFARLHEYPSVHAAAVASGLIKKRPAGYSPAYIEARLRRDFPHIYAMRAEFPSLRAAGVAAGFVKQKPRANGRRNGRVLARRRDADRYDAGVYNGKLRALLSHRIEQLRAPLAEAQERVSRQRAIVSQLEGAGYDASIARSLLTTFEAICATGIAHRERLMAMMRLV